MVGAEENKKSSKDSFLYNKQEKFMLLLHVAKTETIFLISLRKSVCMNTPQMRVLI